MAPSKKPSKTKSSKSLPKGPKSQQKITTATVTLRVSSTNTIVNVSDSNGDVLFWSSSISAEPIRENESERSKAKRAAERVMAKAHDFGIEKMEILIKGKGAGLKPALDALRNSGIEILSEEDITPPASKSLPTGSSVSRSSISKTVSAYVKSRPIEQTRNLIRWDSDPNHGRFGGSPISNHRKLEAVVTQTWEPSAACDLLISVRSTDPKRFPLTGKVRFYLHPTFGKWTEYDVDVVDGVAEDEITSWGVFTIGVKADGGKTLLEFDLADVEDGSEAFYEQ